MVKRTEPMAGQDERSRPSGSLIAVEVVWVAAPAQDADRSDQPTQIVERQLSLPEGTTVAAALESAVTDTVLTALVEGRLTLSVFGERRAPGSALRHGDRVELLGPLLADPKESRLRRAQVQRARNGDSRWHKR